MGTPIGSRYLEAGDGPGGGCPMCSSKYYSCFPCRSTRIYYSILFYFVTSTFLCASEHLQNMVKSLSFVLGALHNLF